MQDGFQGEDRQKERFLALLWRVRDLCCVDQSVMLVIEIKNTGLGND